MDAETETEFQIEDIREHFDTPEDYRAFVAMCMLNAAFSLRNMELPQYLRTILSVRIRDSVASGITDPTEIALGALREEGFSASYKVCGEIGAIWIDDDDPAENSAKH